MNDHELARHLAELAGDALTKLRERGFAESMGVWQLRDQGDSLSHELLAEQLALYRPDDAVLSEEAADDGHRLGADRTWIIDPLDGTADYPFRDSVEWAVHVALVEQGLATAAAVSVPGMNRVLGTDLAEAPSRGPRTEPLVISGRSNTYLAGEVALALGGQVAACGSAGVKAMLVVGGEVDVYVHASELYEWDVCAPAAVADAAGMVVRDLEGGALVYNKSTPIVRGLVVSRPEFAEVVAEALSW